MTYQKLTYSGTEWNNYLYFSFNAEYFDVNIVSDELKIIPTSLMIKGDPAPKSTSWKYQFDAGKNIDLESYLEKMIDLFETKVDDINRLKKKLNLKTRLQFVIYIDINPDSSTPFFGLNNRVIKFLSSTETEVDFDLYTIDTIGLLDNLNED
ncbi:MAG TPA: DUF4279 domain-containing protein [Cytophaga sp.]|jgi:hypothetical protein|nr:DUF4279 domain-containing protein [Cytophaga sp.]